MNTKLIINILIFGVIGLLIWFGVKPAWNLVAISRADLAIKKSEVEKEKQIIDKFNSVNAVLLSNRANVQKLEQAIPVGEAKPEIISIMESLASQNGLGLIGVSVEVVPEDSKNLKQKAGVAPEDKLLKTLKVDLRMNGTYNSFKSWLGALEKSLRVFDINSIAFAPASLSSNNASKETAVVNPVMEYTVSISTYVIKNNN